MEQKDVLQDQNNSAKSGQLNEWVLLRTIDVVSLISYYERSVVEKGLDTHHALTHLQSLSWELYHASHWPLNDETPAIGLKHDYQGIILVNDESRKVVLVHRGLQLDSLPNLVAALTIGGKKSPEIVESALEFCELALRLAETKNYELHHTGFSLGGLLAQITGAHCNHKTRKHNQVVCFDAPGATTIIRSKGYLDNRSNTVNYVTAPNIVNTSNPQYGYVRQIKGFHEANLYLTPNFKPFVVDDRTTLRIDDLQGQATETFISLVVATINCHDQDALRDQLGNNHCFEFSKVRSWPSSSIVFEKIPIDASDNSENKTDINHLMFETMLTKAKEIFALAGYEDCNAVSYQLKNPTVSLHKNDATEVFCITSEQSAPNSPIMAFFNPANTIVDRHEEPVTEELSEDILTNRFVSDQGPNANDSAKLL